MVKQHLLYQSGFSQRNRTHRTDICIIYYKELANRIWGLAKPVQNHRTVSQEGEIMSSTDLYKNRQIFFFPSLSQGNFKPAFIGLPTDSVRFAQIT